ncbi:MAG: hotdog fold thioesterase [Planctomycetota bacterium]|nr:MAG: hotdog fold thioesterase [Planctomycetota bacterium]
MGPRRFQDVGSIDLEVVRSFFDAQIPFNAFLGLRLREVDRGRVLAELPFRPEFIGNPFRPALHGGVISMLADTVGGASLYTLTDPGDQLATIDLRVDYLRPGRPEDLLAEGQVVRWGNRVGVSSIAVHHPGDDEPIAVAKGVYNIKRVST